MDQIKQIDQNQDNKINTQELLDAIKPNGFLNDVNNLEEVGKLLNNEELNEGDKTLLNSLIKTIDEEINRIIENRKVTEEDILLIKVWNDLLGEGDPRVQRLEELMNLENKKMSTEDEILISKFNNIQESKKVTLEPLIDKNNIIGSIDDFLNNETFDYEDEKITPSISIIYDLLLEDVERLEKLRNIIGNTISEMMEKYYVDIISNKQIDYNINEIKTIQMWGTICCGLSLDIDGKRGNIYSSDKTTNEGLSNLCIHQLESIIRNNKPINTGYMGESFEELIKVDEEGKKIDKILNNELLNENDITILNEWNKIYGEKDNYRKELIEKYIYKQLENIADNANNVLQKKDQYKYTTSDIKTIQLYANIIYGENLKIDGQMQNNSIYCKNYTYNLSSNAGLTNMYICTFEIKYRGGLIDLSGFDDLLSIPNIDARLNRLNNDQRKKVMDKFIKTFLRIRQSGKAYENKLKGENLETLLTYLINGEVYKSMDEVIKDELYNIDNMVAANPDMYDKNKIEEYKTKKKNEIKKYNSPEEYYQKLAEEWSDEIIKINRLNILGAKIQVLGDLASEEAKTIDKYEKEIKAIIKNCKDGKIDEKTKDKELSDKKVELDKKLSQISEKKRKQINEIMTNVAYKDLPQETKDYIISIIHQELRQNEIESGSWLLGDNFLEKKGISLNDTEKDLVLQYEGDPKKWKYEHITDPKEKLRIYNKVYNTYLRALPNAYYKSEFRVITTPSGKQHIQHEYSQRNQDLIEMAQNGKIPNGGKLIGVIDKSQGTNMLSLRVGKVNKDNVLKFYCCKNNGEIIQSTNNFPYTISGMDKINSIFKGYDGIEQEIMNRTYSWINRTNEQLRGHGLNIDVLNVYESIKGEQRLEMVGPGEFCQIQNGGKKYYTKTPLNIKYNGEKYEIKFNDPKSSYPNAKLDSYSRRLGDYIFTDIYYAISESQGKTGGKLNIKPNEITLFKIKIGDNYVIIDGDNSETMNNVQNLLKKGGKILPYRYTSPEYIYKTYNKNNGNLETFGEIKEVPYLNADELVYMEEDKDGNLIIYKLDVYGNISTKDKTIKKEERENVNKLNGVNRTMVNTPEVNEIKGSFEIFELQSKINSLYEKMGNASIDRGNAEFTKSFFLSFLSPSAGMINFFDSLKVKDPFTGKDKEDIWQSAFKIADMCDVVRKNEDIFYQVLILLGELKSGRYGLNTGMEEYISTLYNQVDSLVKNCIESDGMNQFCDYFLNSKNVYEKDRAGKIAWERLKQNGLKIVFAIAAAVAVMCAIPSGGSSLALLGVAALSTLAGMVGGRLGQMINEGLNNCKKNTIIDEHGNERSIGYYDPTDVQLVLEGKMELDTFLRGLFKERAVGTISTFSFMFAGRCLGELISTSDSAIAKFIRRIFHNRFDTSQYADDMLNSIIGKGKEGFGAKFSKEFLEECREEISETGGDAIGDKIPGLFRLGGLISLYHSLTPGPNLNIMENTNANFDTIYSRGKTVVFDLCYDATVEVNGKSAIEAIKQYYGIGTSQTTFEFNESTQTIIRKGGSGKGVQKIECEIHLIPTKAPLEARLLVGTSIGNDLGICVDDATGECFFDAYEDEMRPNMEEENRNRLRVFYERNGGVCTVNEDGSLRVIDKHNNSFLFKPSKKIPCELRRGIQVSSRITQTHIDTHLTETVTQEHKEQIRKRLENNEQYIAQLQRALEQLEVTFEDNYLKEYGKKEKGKWEQYMEFMEAKSKIDKIRQGLDTRLNGGVIEGVDSNNITTIEQFLEIYQLGLNEGKFKTEYGDELKLEKLDNDTKMLLTRMFFESVFKPLGIETFVNPNLTLGSDSQELKQVDSERKIQSKDKFDTEFNKIEPKNKETEICLEACKKSFDAAYNELPNLLEEINQNPSKRQELIENFLEKHQLSINESKTDGIKRKKTLSNEQKVFFIEAYNSLIFKPLGLKYIDTSITLNSTVDENFVDIEDSSPDLNISHDWVNTSLETNENGGQRFDSEKAGDELLNLQNKSLNQEGITQENVIEIIEKIEDPVEKTIAKKLRASLDSKIPEGDQRVSIEDKAFMLGQSLLYLQTYRTAFPDISPKEAYELLSSNQNKILHQHLWDLNTSTSSDHGIKHILRGNMTLAEKLFEFVNEEGLSPQEVAQRRVLTMQAIIDHDLGYTNFANKLFDEAAFGKGFHMVSDHPLWSTLYVKEHADFYKKYFGEAGYNALITSIPGHSNAQLGYLQNVFNGTATLDQTVRGILSCVDCAGSPGDYKIAFMFAQKEMIGGLFNAKKVLETNNADAALQSLNGLRETVESMPDGPLKDARRKGIDAFLLGVNDKMAEIDGRTKDQDGYQKEIFNEENCRLLLTPSELEYIEDKKLPKKEKAEAIKQMAKEKYGDNLFEELENAEYEKLVLKYPDLFLSEAEIKEIKSRKFDQDPKKDKAIREDEMKAKGRKKWNQMSSAERKKLIIDGKKMKEMNDLFGFKMGKFLGAYGVQTSIDEETGIPVCGKSAEGGFAIQFELAGESFSYLAEQLGTKTALKSFTGVSEDYIKGYEDSHAEAFVIKLIEQVSNKGQTPGKNFDLSNIESIISEFCKSSDTEMLPISENRFSFKGDHSISIEIKSDNSGLILHGPDGVEITLKFDGKSYEGFNSSLEIISEIESSIDDAVSRLDINEREGLNALKISIKNDIVEIVGEINEQYGNSISWSKEYLDKIADDIINLGENTSVDAIKQKIKEIRYAYHLNMNNVGTSTNPIDNK